MMLFMITSFHPTPSGGVKPEKPTFIKASTYFSARRIAGSVLEVPSDTVGLVHTGLLEAQVPKEAVVIDELEYARKVA